MLLSNKHSPASILLAPFHILLVNQMVEELLDSGNADTCHVFHVGQSECGLCSHGIQNFCVIWSPE